MNIGMILAMLISSGACAPVEFKAPGGAKLHVIVCPMLAPPERPEPPAEEPGDPA